ncbi:hypothetical protein JN531_012700 [Flagellatimonas centrodinii]|uniref:hypothetical protein n=1 Tax=Flagellatimonas centrodinii TaxID=2806210 RepID=UPI001FED8E83|nr:hypothetical protein [Flagellatimonas centrodinii]ULQ45959.1 hypothetical protein JN531_012700 [Flagellatimonas centrodinii]
MTHRDRLLRGITGTKFILCFAALSGSMLGALLGWLSGAEWVATVNITLGIFAGSNVAATFAHKPAASDAAPRLD